MPACASWPETFELFLEASVSAGAGYRAIHIQPHPQEYPGDRVRSAQLAREGKSEAAFQSEWYLSRLRRLGAAGLTVDRLLVIPWRDNAMYQRATLRYLPSMAHGERVSVVRPPQVRRRLGALTGIAGRMSQKYLDSNHTDTPYGGHWQLVGNGTTVPSAVVAPVYSDGAIAGGKLFTSIEPGSALAEWSAAWQEVLAEAAPLVPADPHC